MSINSYELIIQKCCLLNQIIEARNVGMMNDWNNCQNNGDILKSRKAATLMNNVMQLM